MLHAHQAGADSNREQEETARVVRLASVSTHSIITTPPPRPAGGLRSPFLPPPPWHETHKLNFASTHPCTLYTDRKRTFLSFKAGSASEP